MEYWIGVVSFAHARIAITEGICQFNHGKRAPLDRMSPRDCFAIYSPKEEMRGGETLKAFTAIGEVLASDIY